MSGCGSKSGKKVIKECVLAEDQSGTLSGRWPITPVPVALFTGAFSGSDEAAFSAAAAKWNSFYSSSKGFQLINQGGTSGIPRPTNICSGSIVGGSTFSGSVTVYPVSENWPYGSEVIALTTTCPVPGNELPTFTMAAMEINQQNFFGDAPKQPDIESIALHEFGHLVGLRHSCEGFEANGIPKCDSPSLNQAYLAAVMFPAVVFDSSGNGEVKRDLQQNDMERANCLY